MLRLTSLEFLRAIGVCTFVFWHCAKFETFVLNHQKTKEQTIFNFFVALKNTKLLVQTLNICASTNKNYRLIVGGLRPPTINKLDNKEFHQNNQIND